MLCTLLQLRSTVSFNLHFTYNRLVLLLNFLYVYCICLNLLHLTLCRHTVFQKLSLLSLSGKCIFKLKNTERKMQQKTHNLLLSSKIYTDYIYIPDCSFMLLNFFYHKTVTTTPACNVLNVWWWAAIFSLLCLFIIAITKLIGSYLHIFFCIP